MKKVLYLRDIDGHAAGSTAIIPRRLAMVLQSRGTARIIEDEPETAMLRGGETAMRRRGRARDRS